MDCMDRMNRGKITTGDNRYLNHLKHATSVVSQLVTLSVKPATD